MKRFLTIATLLVLATGMTFAEDGAAVYAKRCAMCHGAAGEGKSAPAIKGKADVTDILTKGGKKAPHASKMAGLTEEQVKAVAAHVKGLK